MAILKRRFILSLFIFFTFLVGCFPVFSQDSAVKKGCEYKPVNLKKYGYAKFKEAKIVSSKDGRLSTTLEVALTKRDIAGCATVLRNYNGELVGPTLRLKPGDTLAITLKNKLEPTNKPAPSDINIPHNFNVTNFHSHGLHVSPSGNSDNVLIGIKPGVNFDIEIKVPEDHPTGTFWYHAHVHGSTALQVSSGMAGALIIEDDKSDRSLDSVPEIKAAKQKTFLLQQLGYDEQGEIENYNCFGPGTKTGRGCNWSKSNRHTSINGQFVPTLTIESGEVQRWRFIHGGVRETIDLAISGNNDKAWPLYEIAVDGLSLGYINRWPNIELQPGYRSDILVKAPALDNNEKQQEYWLYDKPSSSAKGLRATDEVRQVLAKIIVIKGNKNMPLPCTTFNQRGKCKNLAKTRPHQDIKDDELTGEAQTVTFNIQGMICKDNSSAACIPCSSGEGCKIRFTINDRPFSTTNIRKLSLGTASEWTLDSKLVNHPYHIHVNPFQHTRKNPDNKDEIVWRDTLLVRQDSPVKIRSRYERYIGKFVIHCHILDHEDQGMMQIVEVELPGGNAHH